MRTIPSELREYLCMPYERLLEIFRLVNECQRNAERTVTKMMEVGDTLDIDADSPKLEEMAFKLRNDLASAGDGDNGVTRRIVRPPTVDARQRPDIEAIQTNQERILDALARIQSTLAQSTPEADQTLQIRSPWEERYQQKRLASYCLASQDTPETITVYEDNKLLFTIQTEIRK